MATKRARKAGLTVTAEVKYVIRTQSYEGRIVPVTHGWRGETRWEYETFDTVEQARDAVLSEADATAGQYLVLAVIEKKERF